MSILGRRDSSADVGGQLHRAPLDLDGFRRTAFGQVIAQHRSERQISLDAFAELIGASRAEVEHLEAGALDGLSVLTAWTIADILGTDIAELLYETRWRTQELAAEQWLAEAMARRYAS